MKMTIKLSAFFLSGILSSTCLAANTPVQLYNQFNADAIKWVKDSGNSSVTGKVFLTLKGGSKKGCAGFNVELLPVADYSSERILKTYGNTIQGQVLVEDNPPKFTPDAPEYHELVLKASCNDENRFEFKAVPAGEYYVMTFIIWDITGEAGPTKTGGAVMKRIKVAPNNTVNL